MNKIIFLFWLFFKKLRTKLVLKFEKKAVPSQILSDKDFTNKLWTIIHSNLVESDNTTYYNTRIKNKDLSNNLAQARVLLSATMLFKKSKSEQLLRLINSLSNYLLTVRTEKKIWLFNQKWWNKQDEGIATIWVLLALLEAYKINGNEDLFRDIIESTNATHKYLYSKINSLNHNIGDNFWCLNAASTYAMYISRLLQFNREDEYIENLNQSINLCSEHVTDEGYFSYSDLRKGTYLLLYNPIVIITLEEALKSEYVDDSVRNNIEVKIEAAKEFISRQRDDEDFFVEPEQKQFSRYIISNITCLVALRNIIKKEKNIEILNNIKSYLINDDLYLCRNENGEFYNGKLYEVKDVLVTEVYFWFNYYLNSDR